LAANRTFDNPRVIVSLSTVPDRINNLMPTIRSLLKQTRPPDEIVLAIPEFSVRERRHYVVPKYISRLPRVRILSTRDDWGPSTKFIAAIKDELAAGRQNTLIMVIDDDRVYPHEMRWKLISIIASSYLRPRFVFAAPPCRPHWIGTMPR
jgi:GT2 family glycosyltransferase